MIKRKQTYRLLTFYKFVDVANPEEEVEKHLEFCDDIGMKGRVYIGSEGISSTVTCNQGQFEAYKTYLDNHELFNNPEDFDIKTTFVDGHKFPRMAVKFREEIVVLGKKYSKEEIDEAGNRMQIDEFKDLLENGNTDDYVVLDMRNDHEYKLGHFKGAIPANTLNFRDLDSQIENYKDKFGDKKIITYCTGGIRCEKSTVMLQNAGLKNTYQLDGGVVKYINTYNDGAWLGNLYVFDDRVSDYVGDEKTHTTIGECIYSDKKTDNCENCRYSPCNARLIADSEEYKNHLGFCSKECADNACNDGLVKDADFDNFGYKSRRNAMKAHPEKKEKLMNEINKHLTKKLEKINYKHELNQKEDLIID